MTSEEMVSRLLYRDGLMLVLDKPAGLAVHRGPKRARATEGECLEDHFDALRFGLPRVPALAERLGTTRSAAALDLWGDQLGGAVVAIGNAPTALFRLLEMLDAGGPRPAAILGIPVGFVGAAESKEALVDGKHGVPYLVVTGRLGGSAMTAAAINALARSGL